MSSHTKLCIKEEGFFNQHGDRSTNLEISDLVLMCKVSLNGPTVARCVEGKYLVTN